MRNIDLYKSTGLLTKREVKMARIRQVFFFIFMAEMESRSINRQKEKEADILSS